MRVFSNCSMLLLASALASGVATAAMAQGGNEAQFRADDAACQRNASAQSPDQSGSDADQSQRYYEAAYAKCMTDRGEVGPDANAQPPYRETEQQTSQYGQQPPAGYDQGGGPPPDGYDAGYPGYSYPYYGYPYGYAAYPYVGWAGWGWGGWGWGGGWGGWGRGYGGGWHGGAPGGWGRGGVPGGWGHGGGGWGGGHPGGGGHGGGGGRH